MATARNEQRAAAARLLGSAPMVIDMVFVYEPEVENDERLFDRYLQSGIHFIQAHPAGEHTVGEAVKRIAQLRHRIRHKCPNAMLVESVEDMLHARDNGKLGVGIQLESFTCLERSLEMVDVYYRLGVRLCHPVWNTLNPIGGGCADNSETLGLTRFGRRVIREMNRVGMLVDGSHAGYRTQCDLLEHSEAPVAFSHHGAYALRPHIRNLRDDVMAACAERGGVIGLTGGAFYLGGEATAERYFRHLDYVVQKVGPEHVGLGIDYMIDSDMLEFMQQHPDEFPGVDEGAWEPLGFMPPEELESVVMLMLQAGYGDEAVHAILGGNWLRICRDVWK